MNFEELLHVAQKNERHKKEPIKCLQTKFKPPTKEQREKDRVLSDGVQRFLARKEEEERRKKKEEERKKEELLALRALDPKANRRIQHMLKRTKSANKSVMEDVDVTNTADTIGGPSQPDEDDYGFVSGETTAMYDKLLQKMYNTPTLNEVKFAPSKKPTGGNLSNTKERVKIALMRQEEEEKGPHKRKRRKKDGGGGEEDDDITCNRPPDDDKKEPDRSERPKPKRPPAPPPMDFMDLLKLAEKKQHEPVLIEPKVKKEVEPDQLMTKKQRMEHEKMLELKRQRELRLKERERISNGKPSTLKRIPKIGQTSSEQRNEPQKASEAKSKSEPSQSSSKFLKNSTNTERLKASVDVKIPKIVDRSSISKPKPSAGSVERVSKKPVESETEKLKRERDEVLRLLKEKEEAVKILEEKERLIRVRDEALAKLKRLEEKEIKSKAIESKGKPMPSVPKTNQPRPSSSEASKTPSIKKVPGRALPQKDVRPTVREFPPKDVRPAVREFPPKDVRPAVREFPPKDVRPAVREFPPKDVRGLPKSNGRPLTKEQKIQLLRKRLAEQKKRRIEDSDDEDEYDSELDDFIDDGPDPTMQKEDVSKAISEIFKYDKNKYSRYDDDTECMESNFAQISKEEFYSAKCGILEDLADIRAEKMAKKAKTKKK